MAVLLILVIGAFAQSKEIKAKGYGTIHGNDKAAARDKAIEDAQRKAVEQAMGTMISSESVTKNFQLISDRILSLSSGYIEKYRVISEKEIDDEVEVEIAAIVGMSKLNDSVQAIKNLIRRMDRPKIMVLIAEQSIREEGQQLSEKSRGDVVLSSTSLGVVENVLIEFF
ncbi:MAG: flagellar assembly protein T N-terminal domain-containing protein, partial [Planctomycetes bacterium]|nr:flagellar assembly protein T N-terminal domain-containing protein [Planctomycetota bacterium]